MFFFLYFYPEPETRFINNCRIAQNSHQKTLVVWSQKYQLVQGLHRAKVRCHVKNFFHFSIIIPDLFPGEASRMRAADALRIFGCPNSTLHQADIPIIHLIPVHSCHDQCSCFSFLFFDRELSALCWETTSREWLSATFSLWCVE